MFGLNKIEGLTKFLIKALTKGIKAGKKIIETYEGAKDEIEKLEAIVEKMEEALLKIESFNHKEEETVEEE